MRDCIGNINVMLWPNLSIVTFLPVNPESELDFVKRMNKLSAPPDVVSWMNVYLNIVPAGTFVEPNFTVSAVHTVLLADPYLL